MRRAMMLLALLAVLVALDATFNGYGVTGAVYREVLEFGRVVNRVVSQGF